MWKHSQVGSNQVCLNDDPWGYGGAIMLEGATEHRNKHLIMHVLTKTNEYKT